MGLFTRGGRTTLSCGVVTKGSSNASARGPAMTTLSIDSDRPPGVTVTGDERLGEAHGLEVAGPWPARCRCDHGRRQDDARLEFKENVQVVRDLDLWGQPSFFVYQPACNRCP